jgi:virulence-associated protein VagC
MFIKYSVVKVYMEKRLSISISEIRAVQMIRDSYVIYLPKDWCEKNFIRKGSRVYIRGLGKRLMIEPITTETKTVEISIDDIDEETLRYILISLYILGYKSLRIYSKKNINIDERKKLRILLRHLKGFEIYEEGRNYIIIREVAEKSDLRSMLIKEFNSVSFLLSMLKDYAELLEEPNRPEEMHKRFDIDIEDVEELDTEIDDARLEIRRLYNKILTDLSIDPGVDQRILSMLISISNILERIGDHASESVKYILEKRFSVEDIKKLREVINEIMRHFIYVNNYLETVLKNIFDTKITEDVPDVKKIIADLSKIINVKKSFREKLLKELSFPDEIFRYHLIRIYDYLTDISEYLIDILVELSISETKYSEEISQG